jgi:hypothetical protein
MLLQEQENQTDISPQNRHERRRRAKASQLGVDLQAYTPLQFCAAYGISKPTLYRRWQRGEGPPFYYEGRLKRIPVAGAAEYQRKLLERSRGAAS